MKLVDNLNVSNADCPREIRRLLGVSVSKQAQAAIANWPGYAATPLRTLPALASELGVGAVWYKDDSSRFGLGSFKALGGAYAVFCLLAERLREVTGRDVLPSDLMHDAALRQHAADFTVACATAGNHGRSVAWGAGLFGCPCRIFVHGGVGNDRVDAMTSLGADVVRVAGNYDDSVRAVAAAAAEHGWTIVSDTSYPGYMKIPLYVMQGYTMMFDEIVRQLADSRPTHVFVQAGVGGLAAAACAYLWDYYGTERPHFVIIEPARAACLQQSIEAGGIDSVRGGLDTCMLGLACGEPSHLAWDILSRGAGHFVSIDDTGIFEAIRSLHSGVWGGERIVAGESAVAGLVGLIECAASNDRGSRLGLTKTSRVLLFGTEGNTDAAVYEQIINSGGTGRHAAQESTGRPRKPREARTR